MQHWIAMCLIFLACSCNSLAQAQPAKPNPGAPPRVLLLVYQQFLPGKAGARQALAIDTARAFDRLDVPATWIELESLTGPPEALYFDPADSFEEIDKTGAALAQLYATHGELAQSQGQIMEMVANSRTLTAVRRDDLSLRANTLDLTKARYLALRVVQVPAAKWGDFQEAMKAAQPKSPSGASWVVYEVNAGMPDGTFLVVTAMSALKELDKRIERSADANPAVDSRFPGETNFYVVRPDMSHVTKDFATGDTAFWVQKTNP